MKTLNSSCGGTTTYVSKSCVRLQITVQLIFNTLYGIIHVRENRRGQSSINKTKNTTNTGHTTQNKQNNKHNKHWAHDTEQTKQ